MHPTLDGKPSCSSVMIRRPGYGLLAMLCAMLACLPFLPGLPGDFMFDDVPNIVENPGIELHSLHPAAVLNAAFSAQLGGHTRVLPTLTYALDYFRGDGFDPATFKTTNIFIHALTTLVLAWFLRSLLLMAQLPRRHAEWFALTMALAWALHPLQVSSVLYIVQRMQTMATLFILLSLCSYLHARQAQMAGRSGRTGWMLATMLWVLALACKEDAILVPAYALALELTVLKFSASQPHAARRIRLGYMWMTVISAALFFLVVVPHYWSWGNYGGRDFSGPDRLLTQGRVLCMYLWQSVVPLPSQMTFYYDWLQPSRGLLTPWTTLPSLLFVLALLGTAWHLRAQRPLFALGVFLFLSGHFVTSNVIGLELAFEHRNHFPLIGVVIAAGDLLRAAADRFNVRGSIRFAVCMLLLVAMGLATAIRAHSWESNLKVAQTSARIAPHSARAWNSLCLAWFERGGGAKRGNPHLDKAIAACNQGAAVGKNSIIGLTNVVAFKAIQGTVTPDDWSRYLTQLQRVPMTAENAKAIWVILNQARDGIGVDGTQVLEAIRITHERRPFGTIESAAIGYFILGHTQQPDSAYPYFARAVEQAKDPSFAVGLIEDLRKEGRPDWAGKLEALRAQRANSSPPH